MEFPSIGKVSSTEVAEGWEGDEGKGGGKKKKSGGFQSLGLSREILNGILRMGYKVPTPIQRRSLPITLGGRDVVAMARTGSGKTAAFLIPLVEKLRAHSSTVGARGLVLSPTRELAQQTYKFAISMAKFTSLRMCLLQRGDRMEAQFEALSNNPDVIIATPGRLVHLLVEVPDFGLKRVEVFVVDEADRLFEMGFAMQLKEILAQLPEQRQTLLFSATMPVQLMEFARAGLHEPELIRLDAETRISENLKLAFFTVRSKEKMAALIHLLTDVIPKDDLTIVFAATRHHVDYIRDMLLELCDIECSVAYGSMDMHARKSNLDRFRTGKVKVLIVTDVAARGLDIPLLNNVVNFEFPCKAKLFIHRVGRAARQGRSGTAFSFVTQDEVPFLVDLHLFLGRPLRGFDEADRSTPYSLAEMTPENVDIGRFPQHVLDSEMERVDSLLETSAELNKLGEVVANAHSLYTRTRQEASRRSLKRAKELGTCPNIHPLFLASHGQHVQSYDDHLKALKSFRPSLTVFEMDALKKGKSTDESVIAMQNKRSYHQEIIHKEKDRQRKVLEDKAKTSSAAGEGEAKEGEEEEEDREELDQATKKLHEMSKPDSVRMDFAVNKSQGSGPAGKKRLSKAELRKLKKAGISASSAYTMEDTRKRGREEMEDSDDHKGEGKVDYRDPDFFVEAVPKDFDAEARSQLAINQRNGEEDEAPTRLEEALLDLTPDEQTEMMTKKRTYHWDKRKKKYVKATFEEHVKSKRFKSESGTAINVKNRGDLYEKWQKVTKKKIAAQGGAEEGADGDSDEDVAPKRPVSEKTLTNVKFIAKKHREFEQVKTRGKNELKDEKTIRKEKKEKEKRREKNGRTPRALRNGKNGKNADNRKKSGGELAFEKFKPKAKGDAGNSRFSRSRVVVKTKAKKPRNRKAN